MQRGTAERSSRKRLAHVLTFAGLWCQRGLRGNLMRVLMRLLGIGLLALLASGCWPAPGAGPDRRSFNPFEQTLTSASVGRLTEAFRVPLADGAGPPVVTGAGLFVRSGLSIRAFAPDNGAARWTASLLTPSGQISSIK